MCVHMRDLTAPCAVAPRAPGSLPAASSKSSAEGHEKICGIVPLKGAPEPAMASGTKSVPILQWCSCRFSRRPAALTQNPQLGAPYSTYSGSALSIASARACCSDEPPEAAVVSLDAEGFGGGLDEPLFPMLYNKRSVIRATEHLLQNSSLVEPRVEPSSLAARRSLASYFYFYFLNLWLVKLRKIGVL